MNQSQTIEALKACQRITGREQVICRPLLANIATPPPGSNWTLTSCPVCAAQCWKSDLEPDELPPGVTAACTGCALRAGMNRGGNRR